MENEKYFKNSTELKNNWETCKENVKKMFSEILEVCEEYLRYWGRYNTRVWKLRWKLEKICEKFT